MVMEALKGDKLEGGDTELPCNAEGVEHRLPKGRRQKSLMVLGMTTASKRDGTIKPQNVEAGKPIWVGCCRERNT